MKKYLCFFICFLAALPVFLHAQTAQKIEDLLNSNALSYEQAAWLVLEAAEISGSRGISSQADAFSYAEQQQWLPKNVRSYDMARLDGVSLLIMQAFDIKGGLLYRFTKSPHYAYRELVYWNIIFGRIDPGMAVSGYEMLYTVNRVLSYKEDNLL